MSFRKVHSIQVSERVFDIVCDDLDTYASEYNMKIAGYLETFNNCREQGYVLTVSSTDWNSKKRTTTNIHIWVHEARSSDEIIVRWQEEYPNNGMYNDETYKERTRTFHFHEYLNAANFVIDLVAKHFEHEFNVRYTGGRY